MFRVSAEEDLFLAPQARLVVARPVSSWVKSKWFSPRARGPRPLRERFSLGAMKGPRAVKRSPRFSRGGVGDPRAANRQPEQA
jgi:hypothetical protein